MPTDDRMPIFIAETDQTPPPGSLIIRKISNDTYEIEDLGVSIEVSEGTKLTVDVALGDSLSGHPPMGTMTTEQHRFVTRQGHWVEVTATDGKLAARYLPTRT